MQVSFPPNIATTIFTVSFTILVAVVTDNLMRSFIKLPKTMNSKRSKTLLMIFQNTLTIIIYVLALYIIFLELGINITPLLASAGIIGVALGFGARSLIEDLIAGLFLLSENSIAIGDTIKVDDVEGTIEKIGFRTVTLVADTGATTIIPNGMVKKLTNFSRHRATINIDIPLAPNQSQKVITKALTEAITQCKKKTEDTPAPIIDAKIAGIEAFSPLTIRVRLVTKSEDRTEIARLFRGIITEQFEKDKIAFA
jgi:moderate conductance mechanosensitive channel